MPSSEGGRFAGLRSPQSCRSQFGSQCPGLHVVPADLLDRKHLRRAPKFSVGKSVVSSHHNPRLLITRDCHARGPDVKLPLLLDAGRHKKRPVLTLPYPEMANGQSCPSPSGDHN